MLTGLAAGIAETLQRLPLMSAAAAIFYAACLTALAASTTRRGRGLIEAALAPHVPSHDTHVAALDALRGLAALWVATWHYHQYLSPYTRHIRRDFPAALYGYNAVSFFVVLSAFLISRGLYVRWETSSSMTGLGGFYLRRFLRVYPLYAVVAMTLALAGLSQGFRNILGEMTMAYAVGFPYSAYPIAWSLYVEVRFYLLVPIWTWLTREAPIAWSLCGFVLFVLLSQGVGPELKIVKYFFAGMIVAIIQMRLAARAGRQGVDPSRRPFARRHGWTILLLLGLGLTYLDLRHVVTVEKLVNTLLQHGGVGYRLEDNAFSSSGLAGAFGIVLLGALNSPPGRAILSAWPLRYLGLISYGIFLWHGLVLIADTTRTFEVVARLDGTEGLPRFTTAMFWGLYLPAICGVATVSYFAVERPCMRLYSRVRGREARSSTSDARSAPPPAPGP